MKHIYKIALVLVIIFFGLKVSAQADSTKTYANTEGFGGPKTVGGQLEVDNKP